MLMFTFSIFYWKYSFFDKFHPKNQNRQLKLKFGTKTNSDMHNSVVMFIVSVFDRNCPFWENLVKKSKMLV